MGRKKKTSAVEVEKDFDVLEHYRGKAIPADGLTPAMSAEMLGDATELNVLSGVLSQLKSAGKVLKDRLEELQERLLSWGSGYVPGLRKPVQMSLDFTIGEKYAWLDEVEQVRTHWKRASELQAEYGTGESWVADAQEQVEKGQNGSQQAQETQEQAKPEGEATPGPSEAGNGRPHVEPTQCTRCSGNGLVEKDGSVETCDVCKGIGAVMPTPQPSERTATILDQCTELRIQADGHKNVAKREDAVRLIARAEHFAKVKKPSKAEAALAQARELLGIPAVETPPAAGDEGD